MRIALLTILGLLAGSMGIRPDAALAQSPTSSVAPAKGYRSGGLGAIIANVNSYKDNVGSINVRIQLIIQNMRDSAVYFVPLLSPSGSSYAATSSTGDIYYMTADSFAGIEACNAHESDIQATAAACLKSFPTGDLTYLEPGQTSVMIVKYSGGGRYDENGNISFALKFLVRQTIKDDLSVDDLTQKKRAGPPAIISISFPLVPLKEDH